MYIIDIQKGAKIEEKLRARRSTMHKLHEEIIQKGAKIEENQFEGIVSRCMN
jgi:hypothetical protein